MKAIRAIISPYSCQLAEYAYTSENRAEWARIEAIGLLKALYPFHDFNPELLVQRNGRILIVPAGLPIQN